MESKFYTYKTKPHKEKQTNSNSPFILPRIYDRAEKKNITNLTQIHWSNYRGTLLKKHTHKK